MLRKSLPFLLVFLLILLIVWVLPQCSHRRVSATGAAQPEAPAEQAVEEDGNRDSDTLPVEPTSQPVQTSDDETSPETKPSRLTDSEEIETLEVAGGVSDENPPEAGTDTATDAKQQDLPPTAHPATPASSDTATVAPPATAPPEAAPTSSQAAAPPPPDAATPQPVERIGRTGQHEAIILDGLYFEQNSDQIQAGSEAALENVVESLKKNPTIRLEIAGYTDDRGDPLYNRILSRRRAEAVMIYLVEHGIDARRLTAAGYGSDDPIASNDSEEGRRKNRRVELHIR